MRLMEGLRLRVKDIDFAYDQITIRDGKGAKLPVFRFMGLDSEAYGKLFRAGSFHQCDSEISTQCRLYGTSYCVDDDSQGE